MQAHAMNQMNDPANKITIVHRMNTEMKGRQLTVEEFFEKVRKEVEIVRNVHPELDGYALYDLRMKFPNGQVELNMEFRR